MFGIIPPPTLNFELKKKQKIKLINNADPPPPSEIPNPPLIAAIITLNKVYLYNVQAN